MRRKLVFAIAVLFAGAGSSLALAQDAGSFVETSRPFLQQQRAIDEALDEQRAQTAPLDEALEFQWGGWFEYFLFNFDDGVQSSRLVQRPGLALWTRLTFDDAHEVFARVKLRYTWFEPGDEIDRQDDWWGPNFDRAWYRVDVGRALRLTTPADPLQLQFKIGRQAMLFGTGYALDLPLDAVRFDAQLYDLTVTGLFGKTIGSYPNIDRSEPVDSHSDRFFSGVQLAYDGFERHVPFVYALWNNDRTDERPTDWFQNYSYDTFYFGAGARGEIVHNLQYWAEGVFETGRSYGDRAFLHQDYVEAYGWDLGLEYLFDLPMRPRIAGQYMFASGDPDRRFSPTSAAGGNVGDDKDSSFVAFGYRDTGIAAGFIPSNLHIWRAGASVAPLERIELFRDFEIGTNWFLYHKNSESGAISDFTATVDEGYVGWEMDYYFNWRLASDISWTTRWGTFFPGDAYRDRDTRHFVFTGIVWSF